MSLEKLEAYVTNAMPHVIDFLVKLILAVFVYFIVSKLTYSITKGLKKLFKKIHMEDSLAGFVTSLIKYIILILTILTIVEKLNIVTQASIVAVLGSAGIAISLALQGGLSNFAGGVIILFIKPFRAGDYIICQKENVEGTVIKIEMYYTTITTMDNQAILVPNSSLTNNTIKNVTANDNRKLEIKVNVSYDTDLKKAKQVLSDLVDKDGRFLTEERIYFVDNLGENAITIGFRAWVHADDYGTARWDMLEKIKERFEKEKIGIPYPQLDVNLKQM